MKLVKRDDCCPLCGHNWWMHEESNVNGKHEQKYCCVYCATVSEKVVYATREDGKYAPRRIVFHNHTSKNREIKDE